MEHINIKIKKKIDRAARTIIFTYGIRGWNMNEFANEAGITKRTLYRYVESKEALVKNALIDFIKETQCKLGEELKGILDFQTGIEHIINIYPSMIIKMNSRVLKSIFLQYPSIEEAVVRERDNFTKDITSFIQEAQKNGTVNGKYDSAMILDVMQSLIIYYSKNQPDQLEEKLKDSISMLIYGIILREEK